MITKASGRPCVQSLAMICAPPAAVSCSATRFSATKLARALTNVPIDEGLAGGLSSARTIGSETALNVRSTSACDQAAKKRERQWHSGCACHRVERPRKDV